MDHISGTPQGGSDTVISSQIEPLGVTDHMIVSVSLKTRVQSLDASMMKLIQHQIARSLSVPSHTFTRQTARQ